MDQKLTIGKVAHESGVSIPSIRFYESQGIIPAPQRTGGGYRLYAPNDVRRLRLARRARLLGLSLPEVKSLVERAFASECGAYAQEILLVVETQRARVDRQIAELEALRRELGSLEAEARQVVEAAPSGLTVATCMRCLLVDTESGERGLCACETSPEGISVDSLTATSQPLVEAGRPPSDADWSLTGVGSPELLPPDALDTLACEVGRRPAGAPTIEEIADAVTGLAREAESLTVTFAPAHAATVRAVVEAERTCCATIGWHLEMAAVVRLRISASPAQLDTLEVMFGGARP